MDIIFHPIGIIRSPYKDISEIPMCGREAPDVEAKIVLDEKYLEGISDMHSGEKYQMLFYFHKSSGYKLKVNRHGEIPMTGLFSTHSPNRPNGIGSSIITITKIIGNHICFTGVDMLDGTPVLDIKSA